MQDDGWVIDRVIKKRKTLWRKREHEAIDSDNSGGGDADRMF